MSNLLLDFYQCYSIKSNTYIYLIQGQYAVLTFPRLPYSVSRINIPTPYHYEVHHVFSKATQNRLSYTYTYNLQ